MPGIAVTSHGTDKAPATFSATENWDELALDVVNVLYNEPPLMAQAFAVATRKLCDDFGVNWPGRVWGSMDELLFTARGPITVPPYYR
jgi:hypothetical protein